jgi:mannose-1-phosphate guanylyltransferase/phosphomannomutase
LALRTHLPDAPRTIAVMANQPLLFDEIAGKYGAHIRRTKTDPLALMNEVGRDGVAYAMSGAGEFIVPSFHGLIDAMFPIAKMLEFLATQRVTLADVAASLPPFHVAQRQVPCSWDQKGTVMRLLNEQFKDTSGESVDGIRIRTDEREWALIVPEADEPIFNIYTESHSDEQAEGLADRYVRIIEGMRA